jgi:hypothetical protein
MVVAKAPGYDRLGAPAPERRAHEADVPESGGADPTFLSLDPNAVNVETAAKAFDGQTIPLGSGTKVATLHGA